MAARVGVEPTTLRLKAIDSTKAPSRPRVMYTQRSESVEKLKKPHENDDDIMNEFKLH